MSDELRVKLCELDGWVRVYVRESFGKGVLSGYPPTASGLLHEVPKLTLDYIHEIEAKLTPEQWAKYSSKLSRIVNRDWRIGPDEMPIAASYDIHATATQRATAILAAVGKGTP